MINMLREFLFPFQKSELINKETREIIHRAQEYNSVPTFQFMSIISLSSVIATFGLAADSAVVIIGAMLIAPLMKPITSLSYAIVTGDWVLKLRSLMTLTLGMLLTVGVSALVDQALGLYEPTEEILSRINPSLIDLGIAIAAGIAATLAATRKNVMDALPGVAIAVSLVPPLCVTGIGISLQSSEIATGSLLLFLVNLVAIVFTSVLVFLMDGFGSIKHSKIGLAVILLIASLQYFPLSDTLENMRADDKAQEIVEDFLHEDYLITGYIHPNDLERLITTIYEHHIVVFLEVKGPDKSIDQTYINEISKRLQAAFELPVNLKVQILDSHEFFNYEFKNEDGSIPKYSTKDLIPKR